MGAIEMTLIKSEFSVISKLFPTVFVTNFSMHYAPRLWRGTRQFPSNDVHISLVPDVGK